MQHTAWHISNMISLSPLNDAFAFATSRMYDLRQPWTDDMLETTMWASHWARINREMFKGVRDGIRARYDILARVEYVSFKPKEFGLLASLYAEHGSKWKDIAGILTTKHARPATPSQVANWARSFLRKNPEKRHHDHKHREQKSRKRRKA